MIEKKLALNVGDQELEEAPFHVPIRGGYQGGARLSKMDCSDTTQSLQVVLVRRFKIHGFGSQCESPMNRRTPFHASRNTWKARAPPILLV